VWTAWGQAVHGVLPGTISTVIELDGLQLTDT
jgi:hypothetical protein